VKLHRLGADTVILCRDSEKAKVTINDIPNETKIVHTKHQGNVLRFRNLDLSSLKSVEQCAQTKLISCLVLRQFQLGKLLLMDSKRPLGLTT